MSDASTLHSFSGYLPYIGFGPGRQIPTYFVAISLALCICLLWLVRRAEKRALSRNLALDIALSAMIAGFFGSRIFHIFFEEPTYYLAEPTRMLEFWKGGFVWYGGAIAGALSGIAVVKYRRERLAGWLDLFAPVAALGYALGRIACLLTGCCYGAVCILSNGYKFRYPTQAFAIGWELAILALLLWLERKRRALKSDSRFVRPGQIFFTWLFGHAVGRIIMELFRDDERGPAVFGLSLSTVVSLLLLVIAAAGFRKQRTAR